MAIALPFLALLGWREMGGRMPPRAAIGVAMAAGLFFALDLAAWHMGIVRTKVANATLFGNCASLLLVLWGIFHARTLPRGWRSEEHTSELQSLMRSSYAVFCFPKN